MKRVIKALGMTAMAALLLASSSCGGTYDGGSVDAAYAGTGMSVGFSYFYDDLAPYGRWVDYSPYGWCWAPYDVGPYWRPYYDGSWAYTEFGWTWVSDEPWGWATYHYGRWQFD